jgi:hypothetical protein
MTSNNDNDHPGYIGGYDHPWQLGAILSLALWYMIGCVIYELFLK